MTFLRSKPILESIFKKKSIESKVDMEALEVYFTLTLASMQVTNDKVQSKGDRDKTCESMQILLEAFTTFNSIVIDISTSTFWYTLKVLQAT